MASITISYKILCCDTVHEPDIWSEKVGNKAAKPATNRIKENPSGRSII